MFWKAKPSLTVSIPQPCHENWERMAIAERGRYCEACQTVVTDFSLLSDDEIISHIGKAAGGKMCGRFALEQVNRPLIADKRIRQISTFRRVAASVLLFCASIYKTSAQSITAQHNTYIADKTKTPANTTTGTTVKGKVIDFTEQGVQGLELQVKGTGLIKTTDAHGNFRFFIPDSIPFTELTIGPTDNGRLFLDSIGALIRESEFIVDTIPPKPVTIYLYPNEIMKEVNIPGGVIVKMAGISTGVVNILPPIDSAKPSPNQPAPCKKASLQRFKDFFNRKSN